MKLELESGGLNLEALRAQSPRPIKKVQGAEKGTQSSAFAKTLEHADRIAQESDQAGADLMSGQVELHEAMVRMEKADLMLKLGTTVRNKLLDAYQQLLSSAGS